MNWLLALGIGFYLGQKFIHASVTTPGGTVVASTPSGASRAPGPATVASVPESVSADFVDSLPSVPPGW